MLICLWIILRCSFLFSTFRSFLGVGKRGGGEKGVVGVFSPEEFRGSSVLLFVCYCWYLSKVFRLWGGHPASDFCVCAY